VCAGGEVENEQEQGGEEGEEGVGGWGRRDVQSKIFLVSVNQTGCGGRGFNGYIPRPKRGKRHVEAHALSVPPCFPASAVRDIVLYIADEKHV